MAQKKFAILKVSSNVSAKSKCWKVWKLARQFALYKFAATVHWLGWVLAFYSTKNIESFKLTDNFRYYDIRYAIYDIAIHKKRGLTDIGLAVLFSSNLSLFFKLKSVKP